MDEHADRATVTPLVIPEIVRLPGEIDIANADQVRTGLCAAAQPGVAVVIADMTATQFCDSCGVRSLLVAHDAADRAGAELRLVIPSAAVTRM
ncbi:MAG TPA: STAS domain-containing protein, partial [Streptosporangiaceae bacterium]|nr:STAS domain-containing protein [Streptosporangiaceae bacterium]